MARIFHFIFPLLFLRSQTQKQKKAQPKAKILTSQNEVFLLFNSNSMNSRELALVSTATVFGALASAFALHFFINPKKKHFPKTHNGVVPANCSPPNPFDPSKRKESVFIFYFFKITYSLFWVLANFLFLCGFEFVGFRYLSWDDYFMAIAFLSAERSKDPNRQVIHLNLLLVSSVLIL